MYTIDQNSAIVSLSDALVPAGDLVDGRTERDRLWFLGEYASLINFYDHTNNPKGSWKPFLLKDPVFLLAYISKTRFDDLYKLYRDSCVKLVQRLQRDDMADTVQSINQLFDELIHVFMMIERWTYYMQRSFEYDLRRYVLHEVKTVFSAYFWAILSFRESMSLANSPAGIDKVYYYLFDNYDEVIWKQSRDLQPYWEVLGLKMADAKKPFSDHENAVRAYQALTAAGDQLFHFLQTIVQHAVPAFEQVKGYRSSYPDTTLLRVFEKLLEIQQAEQNGIALRHLRFYYRDILHQSMLPASADKAFVYATLSNPAASYELPAGTLFNGGLDVQSKPVLFSNPKKVNLTPAVINTAYTLAALPGTGSFTQLYLQQIPAPGTVSFDAQGKAAGWNTFGGPGAKDASLVTAGMILASPMLLLNEGERNISFSLQFNADIDIGLLLSASYSLSTAEAWLQVKPVITYTPAEPVTQNNITISIDLPAVTAPIVSFPKNPEKFSSPWPMLKIVFQEFSGLANPPVITGAKIDVTVQGVKNFQLFNDYGALSSKAPCQLFGPMPSVNNSFIIGSAEIFSKPLSSINIELDWDTLPANFQGYYQQYNNYIAEQPVIAPSPVTPPAEQPGFFKKIWHGIGVVLQPFKVIGTAIWKGLASAGSWVKNTFYPPVLPAPPDTPYNNICFTVGFDLLRSGAWQPFPMIKTSDLDGTVFTADASCYPLAKDMPLFSTHATDTANCVLLPDSFFGLNDFQQASGTIDPSIQQQLLKFTDQSSTGFLRMVLTGPAYGFGSAVYANLVAYIATHNAFAVMEKDKGDIIPAANPPFVPKLTALTANYSASCSYDFTIPENDYPVQCFLFSPISSGIIHDTNDVVDKNTGAILAITGTNNMVRGLPLYPAFPYSGALFLPVTNVQPAGDISLYFQLARNYGNIPEDNVTSFFYLADTGWKPLPVISETTNQFSCPGIITVNVPDDISADNNLPGQNQSWLSIAVSSNVASFSRTILLQTNGFAVQRTGSNYLADTAAPVLPAGAITQPQTTISAIASVNQPFPSFGGKPAENEMMMNQRVANRIKTKDRAVTAEDYYRLIRNAFDDVYYSKTVYNTDDQSTGIYVVRSVADPDAPNAFLPLITECMETEIQSYLSERASVFSNIMVANFDLQYVQVNAVIELKDGYALDGVSRKIKEGLDVFLSPWIINADTTQIAIDTGISESAVIAYISKIEGVLTVVSVSFKTWLLLGTDVQPVLPTADETEIKPVNNTTLFVSSMSHMIQLPTT